MNENINLSYRTKADWNIQVLGPVVFLQGMDIKPDLKGPHINEDVSKALGLDIQHKLRPLF